MVKLETNCYYCGEDSWDEMTTCTDAGDFESYQCLNCGAQTPFEVNRVEAKNAAVYETGRPVYSITRALQEKKEGKCST